MNDTVTILLDFEDDTWTWAPVTSRWVAEWELWKVGLTGRWEGRRVLRAQIVPVQELPEGFA